MAAPPVGLMVIVPLYGPAVSPAVFRVIKGFVTLVVKFPGGAISQPAGVEAAVTL